MNDALQTHTHIPIHHLSNGALNSYGDMIIIHSHRTIAYLLVT